MPDDIYAEAEEFRLRRQMSRSEVYASALREYLARHDADAITSSLNRVYGDGGVHLPAIEPMNYEPVHVVTKSGQAYDGLMRNQDAWSVQFVTMDGRFHSLNRADLTSVTIKPGGIMPTDYDKRLTPDEFRDLMAFLTRQGTKVAASSGGAE